MDRSEHEHVSEILTSVIFGVSDSHMCKRCGSSRRQRRGCAEWRPERQYHGLSVLATRMKSTFGARVLDFDLQVFQQMKARNLSGHHTKFLYAMLDAQMSGSRIRRQKQDDLNLLRKMRLSIPASCVTERGCMCTCADNDTPASCCDADSTSSSRTSISDSPIISFDQAQREATALARVHQIKRVQDRMSLHELISRQPQVAVDSHC